MGDIMPRRNGPENLRILKRQLSFLLLRHAVEFFGSLLAEILNTMRCATRWRWDQHSMVSIDF